MDLRVDVDKDTNFVSVSLDGGCKLDDSDVLDIVREKVHCCYKVDDFFKYFDSSYTIKCNNFDLFFKFDDNIKISVKLHGDEYWSPINIINPKNNIDSVCCPVCALIFEGYLYIIINFPEETDLRREFEFEPEDNTLMLTGETKLLKIKIKDNNIEDKYKISNINKFKFTNYYISLFKNDNDIKLLLFDPTNDNSNKPDSLYTLIRQPNYIPREHKIKVLSLKELNFINLPREKEEIQKFATVNKKLKINYE